MIGNRRPIETCKSDYTCANCGRVESMLPAALIESSRTHCPACGNSFWLKGRRSVKVVGKNPYEREFAKARVN